QHVGQRLALPVRAARPVARPGEAVGPLPARRLPPGATGRVDGARLAARQRHAVRAGRAANICHHSGSPDMSGHDSTAMQVWADAALAPWRLALQATQAMALVPRSDEWVALRRDDPEVWRELRAL